MAASSANMPLAPHTRYTVWKFVYVNVSRMPPMKGAINLPRSVADEKIDILSPLREGNKSATSATDTGPKMAVANP